MHLSAEIDKRIEELERQLASTHEDQLILLQEKGTPSLYQEGHELNVDEYDPERLTEWIQKANEISDRRIQILEELDAYRELQRKLYKRPSGGFFSFINKLLPALPEHHFATRPTKEMMKRIPAKPQQAVWTIVACIAAILALMLTVPWTAVVPLAALMKATGYAGIFLIIAAFAAAFFHARSLRVHTHWSTQEVGFFNSIALSIEHRFRLGAEQWSLPVQVWVSLIFGLSYAITLLPVAIWAGFAVLGFILTRTYINAYNRTRSVDTAILTTAKLHATVMRLFVFVVTPILIGILIFGYILQ